ncbi:hypothetical protein C2S53_008053 [Perilla frutescens var. hirtella]|uniref:Transposase n=1 Tax=Perilla frutescens var. hirtella TaxID=608512 RepID=A0AAD4ITC8_PERFH|nr:hypothetical protein C2S53_008053 [Perilla frutescens var. hirtella]
MVKRHSTTRNNEPLFRPVQEMNDFGGTPGNVSDLETCIRMCEQAPPAERPTIYRILQSTITRDPKSYAVIGNLTEFSSALMAFWESKYGHVNALAKKNPSSVVEPELLRATLNSPPGFQAPCPRAEGTLEARPLIIQDTEFLSSRMHQWAPAYQPVALQSLGQRMPHQFPEESLRKFKFEVPETDEDEEEEDPGKNPITRITIRLARTVITTIIADYHQPSDGVSAIAAIIVDATHQASAVNDRTIKRMDTNTDQQQNFLVIHEVVQNVRVFIFFMNYLYLRMRRRVMSGDDRTIRYSLKEKVSKQLEHMHNLVNLDDVTCLDHLQMNRNTFGRLCFLLENVGGLVPTRHVQVPEQVAMFLGILEHHTKNRIVKYNFKRLGYTISKHFNAVLKALLKLHNILLVKPQPIADDSTNDRWKYFKGCLGTLDGTYIPVKVLQSDKARYKNKKGNVTVNMLAVCDQNMNYVYVLTGWEGFSADSRVLRDAITRPNGLKVPTDMPYDPLESTIPEDWTDNASHVQLDEDFIDQNQLKMSGRKRTIGGENKSDKTRRIWTLREEQELIVALKEAVARGWKCDNGFRTGYLGLLEQHMLQAIPGNDLKAEPHIISKIHVWKKNYGSLSTMLSRSGFGWNESTHTIEVDSDEIWSNYIKTDNNARTMRSKSWPFYKDWCEIFGKDRATGEYAETFSTQDLLHKDEESLHTSTGNDYVQFTSSNQDEEVGDDFMSMSREGTSSNTKVKDKGQKRKSLNSLDDRFLDLMNVFCEKTDSRMGELVQRIGFEHDASLSRKKVYEALGNMNHLTDEEQIYVAKSLCNNTKDLDLFFSLPDEKKVVMVRMILSGKI